MKEDNISLPWASNSEQQYILYQDKNCSGNFDQKSRNSETIYNYGYSFSRYLPLQKLQGEYSRVTVCIL